MMMKPGDLVEIVARELMSPTEPIYGIILYPTSLENDGDQIAGECDWWLLWNGEEMPFPSEMLEVIGGRKSRGRSASSDVRRHARRPKHPRKSAARPPD
jgi:hypothetical protein